jgi:hypothetical protein
MPIDPNIIIGISTAVGAGVGGSITLLAARRQAHIDALEAKTKKLERDYIDACEQIAAFHKLEEAHAKEHASLTGKTENQLKLEIRKKVEDAGGGRPTWSAREALNEIKRTQG